MKYFDSIIWLVMAGLVLVIGVFAERFYAGGPGRLASGRPIPKWFGRLWFYGFSFVALYLGIRAFLKSTCLKRGDLRAVGQLANKRGQMKSPSATLLQIVPEGGFENGPRWSPPQRTEPWDGDQVKSAPSRRANRISPPNIARVVVNLVLLQEGKKLRLEIVLPMMYFLTRNIRQCRVNLTHSDGKGTVTLLPFETPHPACFIHPVRGRALDLPHRFCHRERRWERKKDVEMILRSTNSEGFPSVFSRNASYIGPQPGLDLRRDDFASCLRGKDTMEQRATISV